METSRENCQKIRAKHHRKIRAQDKNFPALFVLLYNLDLFARSHYEEFLKDYDADSLTYIDKIFEEITLLTLF
jgi:hypothetical protein